jgi:uncharacterized membrane protein YGL010W
MSIHDWFEKYGESHQNKINKNIHWICVPAIFFSLIGLLSLVPLPMGSNLMPMYLEKQMHLGTLLIIFGIFFFSRLSIPITIGMLMVSVLILQGVTYLHNADLNVGMICLSIFVVAWIGQFIGHKIEGAKPSFFDDLKFLLIGPAWLLSFIYQKLGIKY